MASESEELLQKCNHAIDAGADFPTVWQELLRGHWLVRGSPVQAMDGQRAQLHIPLVTGQKLVFDSTSKMFSIG